MGAAGGGGWSSVGLARISSNAGYQMHPALRRRLGAMALLSGAKDEWGIWCGENSGGPSEPLSVGFNLLGYWASDFY